jgi:hypothetical protein
MSKSGYAKRKFKIKQVESSIKIATLVVTKVTLVRIVLKLNLKLIHCLMMIYLM